MSQHTDDFFKHVADTVATTITVGAVLELVPVIVAVINGLYILFRLFELIERRYKHGRVSKDEE